MKFHSIDYEAQCTHSRRESTSISRSTKTLFLYGGTFSTREVCPVMRTRWSEQVERLATGEGCGEWCSGCPGCGKVMEARTKDGTGAVLGEMNLDRAGTEQALFQSLSAYSAWPRSASACVLAVCRARPPLLPFRPPSATQTSPPSTPLSHSRSSHLHISPSIHILITTTTIPFRLSDSLPIPCLSQPLSFR